MRREMLDNVDSKLLKHFEVIRKIGQGAYGQVWKARDKRTGSLCALKKIYDAFRNSTDAQRAYREIRYLQRLNHPNIVKLLSFCRPDSTRDVYLALQFMESDLSSAIRDNVLKEIHKHFIFFQIANAVHYLHSAQLIHRDIKPSNILVNENCEAKLCDFGLVRSLVPSDQKQRVVLTENIATRWYRAPEILLCSNSYGKEIDVWSLGCVLAEVFLGRPLFQGTSAISQLERIFEVTGKPAREELEFVRSEASRSIVESMTVSRKKSIAEIFYRADEQMVDLLQRIFQVNPRKRITIDEVVKHPFVNRFKGKAEERKSNEPIKILHEAEALSVEQYRALLYCELEEKSPLPDLISGKSSEMSTFYESSITHSLPNNSRHQFFANTSPLARHDRATKPENSFLPLPTFPSLQEIGREDPSLKTTYKRPKVLHDLKVPKPQFPFQSNRNLCIRQDKSADSRAFKTPEIHRTFTPMRAKDYSPIGQERKAVSRMCCDTLAKTAARKNEPFLRVVNEMDGGFPKAGSNRASPLKSNEQSKKDFHPKRTMGAKEERAAKNVPKFILEGRKKFRSGSPLQLPEGKQDSAVLNKQKTISYLQPAGSGFPRLPQRQPSAISPFILK